MKEIILQLSSVIPESGVVIMTKDGSKQPYFGGLQDLWSVLRPHVREMTFNRDPAVTKCSIEIDKNNIIFKVGPFNLGYIIL